MSGTYRTALVYVKDGHFSRGQNARTAAAEMRKIDRRKKRREASSIKREAMREYEAEIADAQEETLRLAIDEDYGDFGDDWEGYDDLLPDPDQDMSDLWYSWDDFSDYGQYDKEFSYGHD